MIQRRISISVYQILSAKVWNIIHNAKYFSFIYPQKHFSHTNILPHCILEMHSNSFMVNGRSSERRDQARLACNVETINDMLKNTAQIVHSRHRSVSNFIMNLIPALGAYCFFDNKPKALQGYCIEDTKQLSLF